MSYIVKRVPKPKDQAPDQVVSTYQRITEWTRANINAVIYASGAVLFVILLVLGFFWVKENRERAASEALAQAVLSLNAAENPASLSAMNGGNAQDGFSTQSQAQAAIAPDLEAALNAFREVAQEQGDRSAGLSARLYAANILFRLGRYQEATETIEALTAQAPGFASEAGADYLLARAYEAMKDYGQATGTYSQILDRVRGDARAAVMVDLARCLELSGEVDRAVSLLQDVVKEFPKTASSSKADRKLALLGLSSGSTP